MSMFILKFGHNKTGNIINAVDICLLHLYDWGVLYIKSMIYVKNCMYNNNSANIFLQ